MLIFFAKNIKYNCLNNQFFCKKCPFRSDTNYTRTKNYLASLVVGNDRIGLDGMPTSKVTKEETKNIKQTDSKKSKQVNTQKSLEEKTNSANVTTGAA